MVRDTNNGEFIGPGGYRSTNWATAAEHEILFATGLDTSDWSLSLDHQILDIADGTHFRVHVVAIDNSNNQDNDWPWTFQRFIFQTQ